MDQRTWTSSMMRMFTSGGFHLEFRSFQPAWIVLEQPRFLRKRSVAKGWFDALHLMISTVHPAGSPIPPRTMSGATNCPCRRRNFSSTRYFRLALKCQRHLNSAISRSFSLPCLSKQQPWIHKNAKIEHFRISSSPPPQKHLFQEDATTVKPCPFLNPALKQPPLRPLPVLALPHFSSPPSASQQCTAFHAGLRGTTPSQKTRLFVTFGHISLTKNLNPLLSFTQFPFRHCCSTL
jgi:hypothetical protein